MGEELLRPCLIYARGHTIGSLEDLDLCRLDLFLSVNEAFFDSRNSILLHRLFVEPKGLAMKRGRYFGEPGLDSIVGGRHDLTSDEDRKKSFDSFLENYSGVFSDIECQLRYGFDKKKVVLNPVVYVFEDRVRSDIIGNIRSA